jgi:Protein of unknown function (DUF3060)
MTSQDDPEERIRELERPLADQRRASEGNGSWGYSGDGGYGDPFPGHPPPHSSGNRVWWILGAVFVVGAIGLAAGIAAFASHQLAPVRSIIVSPPAGPSVSEPQAGTPAVPAPSTSSSGVVPHSKISISGTNQHRTIACVGNTIDISGVSNTVVITGNCSSLTVSGVRNSVTIDAVDGIDVSGFDNKVTYHAGTPMISNSGGSNVVAQG